MRECRADSLISGCFTTELCLKLRSHCCSDASHLSGSGYGARRSGLGRIPMCREWLRLAFSFLPLAILPYSASCVFCSDGCPKNDHRPRPRRYVCCEQSSIPTERNTLTMDSTRYIGMDVHKGAYFDCSRKCFRHRRWSASSKCLSTLAKQYKPCSVERRPVSGVCSSWQLASGTIRPDHSSSGSAAGVRSLRK
jgi:hypothetical protein